VSALEDCRHVSGAFERFLIARGERVLRVPTRLMAGARRGARERGKSDSINVPAPLLGALQPVTSAPHQDPGPKIRGAARAKIAREAARWRLHAKTSGDDDISAHCRTVRPWPDNSCLPVRGQDDTRVAEAGL
jgi:hypothetical protein